jgi:Ca2+-binding RTX toxin-like protein
MRRTTTLTAAGLLGLALLAPTTSAGAAAPTCRGVSATIVGEPGSRVVGTEGADVIVTDGAMSVHALGGDDVICVNGETGFPPAAPVQVDAGPGNDAVDSTSSVNAVFATLGTGTDAFVGGDEDDRVTLGHPDPVSGAPDTLDGGGGSDGLFLTTGPGAAVIDNVVGSLTSDGQPRARWRGLEEFWLEHSTDQRPLRFVGSDADEVVVDRTSGPAQVQVDLGAGDDAYRTSVPPLAGSRIGGGPGRDLLEVASEDADLALDLKRWRLEVAGPAPYPVSTVDLEDANLFAPGVLLKGTPQRNRLGFTACRAVVKGREGADTIRRTYDALLGTDLDCEESARIAAGPGNDVVTGTRGADVILGNDGNDALRGGNGTDKVFGGRGRDRADGGEGRDRCTAERERRCER